jgi:KRAB domain-containing zinc finger protein
LLMTRWRITRLFTISFWARTTLKWTDRYVYLQVVGHRCDVCGKSFSTKGNLFLHQRSLHLGIFPYTCGTCGKGYTSRDNLNGHMFKHTGEMAHACLFCNKTFRWKKLLKKHIKNIHHVEHWTNTSMLPTQPTISESHMETNMYD